MRMIGPHPSYHMAYNDLNMRSCGFLSTYFRFNNTLFPKVQTLSLAQNRNYVYLLLAEVSFLSFGKVFNLNPYFFASILISLSKLM